INGKNSELHAAMGLCTLPMVDKFIQQRQELIQLYNSKLSALGLKRPVEQTNLKYNAAYYPVVFPSEGELLKAKGLLADNQINTRRYFYPSLNNLPYLAGPKQCPVSEDIAKRVLCLPLYYELSVAEVEKICNILFEL